jgi:hypothetical protein
MALRFISAAARMGDSSNTATDVSRLEALWRVLVVGAAVVVLGGCATAQVADVTASSVPQHQPTEILVDAQPALGSDDPHVAAATEVSNALQRELIQKLTKSGITADAYRPGAVPAGAAVLHISITDADPGNALERFVIGFGAGRAKLAVTAELRADGPSAGSMTRFVTMSDSGHKLGLIVPGGVAAATGKVIHLAIGGGIDVITSINGGLAKPVRATTNVIARELQKYYDRSGWTWPVRA